MWLSDDLAWRNSSAICEISPEFCHATGPEWQKAAAWSAEAMSASTSSILPAVRRSVSARNLRLTLYVLAVIPVVAGAATVLLGGDSIPDAGQPTASVESELRFYSVWWIGAGVFLAWLAPRIEERTRELRAFCAFLFLAGISRVLAIVVVGWPHPSQVVLMAIELTLPIVLVVWQSRVASSSPAQP
jgi:hypothetical protein